MVVEEVEDVEDVEEVVLDVVEVELEVLEVVELEVEVDELVEVDVEVELEVEVEVEVEVVLEVVLLVEVVVEEVVDSVFDVVEEVEDEVEEVVEVVVVVVEVEVDVEVDVEVEVEVEVEVLVVVEVVVTAFGSLNESTKNEPPEGSEFLRVTPSILVKADSASTKEVQVPSFTLARTVLSDVCHSTSTLYQVFITQVSIGVSAVPTKLISPGEPPPSFMNTPKRNVPPSLNLTIWFVAPTFRALERM